MGKTQDNHSKLHFYQELLLIIIQYKMQVEQHKIQELLILLLILLILKPEVLKALLLHKDFLDKINYYSHNKIKQV